MLQREGYVLVQEASEILGVCPNTVRTWGAEGKIPEFRHPVNNYRLYRKADLTRIQRQLERSVSQVSHSLERKKSK
jgi:DNA (cytosine-5)-methyltransferase 1